MKTLKQFYRELQAWIDAGCPEHEVFKVNDAICDALTNWMDEYGDGLLSEISDQFSSAGLCRTFPFNKGFFSDYAEECLDGNYYKNPARLAWIKEHAA